MDKKDLERRLEAAEKQNLGLLDEIKNLKEQLAKVQDEPEIPDFPVFSAEPLYFMDNRFCIVGDESNICNGDADGDFNMFHTEGYAQEFANKCKLIAMMLHCKWYIDRDALDTSEKTWVWGTGYDKTNKKFVPLSYCLCEPSAVTFRSEELAQKAADWLNAHWKEDGNGTD